MKFIRKLTLAVVCVALVLAAAAFALTQFGGSYAAKKICYAVESVLGGELRLPSVTLTPWPLGLELQNVAFHSSQLQFTAKSARFNIQPWSLLGDRLDLRDVVLEEPRLVCSGWPVMRRDSQHASPQATADRISISNGEFVYQTEKVAASLKAVNLSVAEDQQRRDLALTADFHVDAGSRGQAPDLAGEVSLSCRLRYYQPTLSIRFGGLTYSPNVPDAPTQLSFSGSLNTASQRLPLFKLNLVSADTQLNISGTGGWHPLNLAGQWNGALLADKLGGGLTSLSARGTWHLDADELELAPLDLKLGNSEGKGYLLYAFPTPASQISGEFKLDQLALEELPTFPSQRKNSAWPDLDLRLDARRVSWRAISSPDTWLKIVGSAGHYAIGTGNGDNTLEADADVNLANGAFLLTLQKIKLEAGSFLTALGVAANGGEADLQGQLKGSFHGDWQTIARSLDGSLSVAMKNLQIDELQKLDRELSDWLPGSIPDRVDCLTAICTAQDGQLNLESLSLQANGFSATGKMELDLPADAARGELTLHAFDREIPLVVRGKADHPEFSLAPGALEALAKSLL